MPNHIGVMLKSLGPLLDYQMSWLSLLCLFRGTAINWPGSVNRSFFIWKHAEV